jgi:hypothetical protein
MDWDPSQFRSVEDAALSRAEMDSEFGMPRKPYANTRFGRLVNREHYSRATEMNNEFGWGPLPRAQI